MCPLNKSVHLLCSFPVYEEKKQKKEKKRLLVNAVKGINAYINYKYIYIYI